jgi:hypothetical protein
VRAVELPPGDSELELFIASHIGTCHDLDCALCVSSQVENAAELSVMDDPETFIHDALCAGDCPKCELHAVGHAVVAFDWQPRKVS